MRTAHAAAEARLLHALQARGFVESLAGASSASADVGLVRSVLAAGFYPQVWIHLTGPRPYIDRVDTLSLSGIQRVMCMA